MSEDLKKIGEITLGDRVIVGDPSYPKCKTGSGLVSKKCMSGKYNIYNTGDTLVAEWVDFDPKHVAKSNRRFVGNDTVTLGIFDEERYPLVSGLQRDGTDYGYYLEFDLSENEDFYDRVRESLDWTIRDYRNLVGIVAEGVVTSVAGEIDLPVIFYYNKDNKVIKIELFKDI